MMDKQTLMADFFALYEDFSNEFENVEDYIEEHTDAKGDVSEKHAEIINQKTKELKKLRKNLKRAYDKLDTEYLSQPTTKPILNNPNDDYFGETQNYVTSGGVQGKSYQKNFVSECRSQFRTAYNTLQESPLDTGGYLLPSEFSAEIVSELKEENILRQIGRVVQTQNDREIAIVATPPTANFIAEGQEINLSTEGFSRKTLKAYKLAAGVSVSNELLADSFYDVESHLQLEFAKAIAAKEENAFINGTGTNEPKGLITTLAADSSTTITTAGNNLAADDLINLAYSLPRPYRKNAAFLVNDTTLAAIRKLKDSTQNYLWERSMALNEPSTLLGYPVYTSEFMPGIASGNIPVLFGDFSKFVVGQRAEMSFKPLRELHALQDLTTYLMIERVDGVLSDKFAIRGLKIK